MRSTDTMNLQPPESDGSSLGWSVPDGARTPYKVFTDQNVYEREQLRIFRGPTWSFLALTAELPNRGDYKSTFIGDTPVVVTLANDGSYCGWVNRCAHRGAKVCRHNRGNATEFVCIYHQWLYDQQGNLTGAPFSRGLKGLPGMPSDFDRNEHGLQKLRVESYGSMIFATFDSNAESLFDYIGPEMRPWIDRLFNRPVEYLGCLRQFANSNWKLYFENVKDPYHGSLLHMFLNTFNVARANMTGHTIVDARHGLHSILTAAPNLQSRSADIYKQNDVRSYKEGSRLNDTAVLDVRNEFEDRIVTHIQTIFPSLVIQQINNTLACRQILPKGSDSFELVFHLFGYADDDQDLRAMRLLQANLIGPAGFISMEDTEVTELIQQAISPDARHESVIYMGRGAGDINNANLITEELIRRFWIGYRGMMEG
jgi:anthranilate 1,2-dioxygenase large subunit